MRGVAYAMEVGLKMIDYLGFCGEDFLCGRVCERCDGGEMGGVFIMVK